MKYSVLSRIRQMSDNELVEVALRVAEIHPETFEKLISVHEVIFNVPHTDLRVGFTSDQVKELRTYTIDTKVPCIKRIRQITGLAFKEAKDLCEAEFVKRDYRREDY